MFIKLSDILRWAGELSKPASLDAANVLRSALFAVLSTMPIFKGIWMQRVVSLSLLRAMFSPAQSEKSMQSNCTQLESLNLSIFATYITFNSINSEASWLLMTQRYWYSRYPIGK